MKVCIGISVDETKSNSGNDSSVNNDELLDESFSGMLPFFTMLSPSKKLVGRCYTFEDRKFFIPEKTIESTFALDGVSFLTCLMLHFIRGKFGNLIHHQVNPTVYKFIKYLYGIRLRKLAPANLDEAGEAVQIMFRNTARKAFEMARKILINKENNNN